MMKDRYTFTRYSAAELRQLERLAKQGFMFREIAERMPGRSVDSIEQAVKTRGMTLSDYRWGDGRRETLLALQADGLSPVEIAEQIGLPRRVVDIEFRALGLVSAKGRGWHMAAGDRAAKPRKPKKIKPVQVVPPHAMAAKWSSTPTGCRHVANNPRNWTPTQYCNATPNSETVFCAAHNPMVRAPVSDVLKRERV